ncbi:hypothetical protein IT407_01360 [Candidatus Uhrbacteria bacterium]|nr:hypothetical protein [Candidatus Uhrbacteria bacterium]
MPPIPEAAIKQSKAKRIPKINLETLNAPELIPYSELLESVHAKAKRVNEELDRERDISAEIRKMGSVISKEGAAQVHRLEDKFNALLRVYKNTLEPVRKERSIAFLNKEELLVEKPSNFDLLMEDPAIQTLDPEDLVEVPSSKEMRMQETQLLVRETEIEEELDVIIDELNRVTPLQNALTETAIQLDEERRKMLTSRANSLYRDLRGIRQQLSDIKLNIGMAKRIEGQDMRAAA